MKKSAIIALSICLAGILIFCIGLSFTRKNAKRTYEKGIGMRTEKNYTCSGKINGLAVNETNIKAVIKRGDVKTPEIRYYIDEDREEVIIEEKDGKLTFTRKGKKLFFFFNVDFSQYVTEIVLPEDFNGSVDCVSNSGGAEVTGLNGTTVAVRSSSGSVKVEDIRAEELTVSASSGSVRVDDIEIAGNAMFKTNSGSIKANSVKCKDLSSESTSGSNEIKAAEAKNIKVTATSGSIRCYDLTAVKNIELSNSSGSIRLEDSEAERIVSKNNSGGHDYANVKVDSILAETTSGSLKFSRLDIGKSGEFSANSGSVKGSIIGSEEDFSIITKTGSGSSNLTDTRSGDKTLDITTTSGSIKVSFEK